MELNIAPFDKMIDFSYKHPFQNTHPNDTDEQFLDVIELRLYSFSLDIHFHISWNVWFDVF